jgi:HD-GYP domain-containing protein (c-di-GMP phosphodiesterase class II)
MTVSREIRRRVLDRVTLGLLLMDAGITKLPAFILNKAVPLKQEEWDKIMIHPQAGLKMMSKLNLSFEELNMAIAQHHERLDGSGYPQKLKGSAISAVGRLAAVADSFAAMITTRPYGKAVPPASAAQSLAQDRNRYDVQYTVPLNNAYLTNEFGSAGPKA